MEEALLAHPALAEVAVVGLPHPKWGETIHAAVVLATGAAIDAAGVIAHARSRLASYKKPTGVTFLERLPTMANGKVDKVALRKMLAG